MPRAKRERQYLSLNKGLFTEGGYLNSPIDTWTDAANIEPKRTGAIERRKGIDYEEGYILDSTNTSTEKTERAYTVGYWDNAGGTSQNFLVVQRGATLEFFDNVADETSSTKDATTISLSSYKPSTNGNTSGDAPVQCASANGKLLVVSGDTEPLLIEYTPSSGAIAATQLDLKIRDLEGVDDGLDVDENPTGNPYSANHTYNLQNQGWVTADINTYRTHTGGDEPSNAQQWFHGVSGTTFSGAQLDSNEFGSTPAPKGYYILDLFDQQRDAHVAGVTDVIEDYRPTTVEFFAGRAWYAGIQSERILSNVYFSQVAIDSDQFAYCYQKNDPTAEIISDIVADDGGVIPIQDCGRIVSLKATMDSMFVFADNGIWRIAPGSGGFSATSYSVEKISNTACVGRDTVVNVEDTIYFWSNSGIYTLSYRYSTQTGVTGKFTVQPITEQTIKTLYGTIVLNAKEYAQGVYDVENRVITWCYNSSTTASSSDDRFQKDRILCLDLNLNSWFKHHVEALSSSSPYIQAVFLTKGRSRLTVEAQVRTVLSDDVLDASSDNVVVTVDIDQARNRSIKYLVMTEQGANDFRLTMADFFTLETSDNKWKDWYTADSTGASVVPYIETGYHLDNPGHKMDNIYLTTYVLRTDTGIDDDGNATDSGSVLLQGRWEWTDASSSGRWTTQEQLYRPQLIVFTSGTSTTAPFPFPIIPAKSKLRGSGASLQLRYEGEADKDFKLAGCSIDYTIARNT